MKTTTIFATPKGTKVELTTENITKETVNADGHETEITTDIIVINEFKVNDELIKKAYLTTYQGKKVINFGTTTANGKQCPLLVLIDGEVYNKHWGEYDKRIMERAKRQDEVDKKYYADYNKVMKAMQE